MRGLAIGEVSSLTNPLLQLYVRSGGYLADIYSGSYRIEDIRTPGDDPAVKVTTTPLTSGDKLGTGRYAIAAADTSGWKVGTHRVVASYKLTETGPTYTQVVEFEVLDPVDWPSGRAYVGYLSTRDAVRDGFMDQSASRQDMHRSIADVSYKIEQWTGRWFEPRYLKLKTSGKESSILLLSSPIIAIEDIYAVWKTTTGEDTYKFEQYLYKVYNRHLDSELEADDRKNPHVELTNVTGTIVRVSGFTWPYGNQNIELRGVFGYTDPDFDPNLGNTLLGHTPRDLGRAVGALVTRQVADPSMSDPVTWAPSSIKSMRTRYQSITFGGSAGGVAGGGSGGAGAGDLAGDALVDAILAKYCRPPTFGAV